MLDLQWDTAECVTHSLRWTLKSVTDDILRGQKIIKLKD